MNDKEYLLQNEVNWFQKHFHVPGQRSSYYSNEKSLELNLTFKWYLCKFHSWFVRYKIFRDVHKEENSYVNKAQYFCEKMLIIPKTILLSIIRDPQQTKRLLVSGLLISERRRRWISKVRLNSQLYLVILFVKYVVYTENISFKDKI